MVQYCVVIVNKKVLPEPNRWRRGGSNRTRGWL